MTKARRGRAWDVAVMALLVGSVALVFWHTASEDGATRRVLEWVDLGLCAFFVLEWAWRLGQAPRRGRFAATHCWELLGMVPLVAPLPAGLRALRLLRVMRILRLFGTLGRTLGTWERIAKESSIHKVALASGLVTVGGAILTLLLERDAPHANITNLKDALWWAVVTVTTVGFGDHYPVTDGGRMVAAILMVTGIGTIGLLASSLASVLVVRKEGELQVAPPVMAGKLVVELQTLVALHEAGKLTDAEYAAAKAKLLR